MSALGDRALALLRRLEFGEPYGRRGVRGFVRACPDCENEISEDAVEETVDRYAHRHNPGCVLASILDDAIDAGGRSSPTSARGASSVTASSARSPDLRTHCVCGAPYANGPIGGAS